MATVIPHSLLPEVQRFLESGVKKGFVNGKDIEASNSETFFTKDPGSGATLAEVVALQAKDVDLAIDAANLAFQKQAWARLAPNDRSAMLHRLADGIEKHKAIIGQIEALDAGKLEAHAQGDVQNCADTLRYFADLSQHARLAASIARSTSSACNATTSARVTPVPGSLVKNVSLLEASISFPPTKPFLTPLSRNRWTSGSNEWAITEAI